MGRKETCFCITLPKARWLFAVLLAFFALLSPSAVRAADAAVAAGEKADTKLLVAECSPARDSDNAPIDAAVVFRFNEKNVEIKDSFQIEPQVMGSFQFSDDGSVFLPEAPLKAGQKYTVTLKKGLKAPSGALLESDFTLVFTTKPAEQQSPSTANLQTTMYENFTTVLPNEAFLFPVNLLLPDKQEEDINSLRFKVTAHRISGAAAFSKEYRALQSALKSDSMAAAKTEKLAATETFNNLELIEPPNGGGYYRGETILYSSKKDNSGFSQECGAVIPGLPEGNYLLTMTGEGAGAAGQLAQLFVQVSSLQAYTQSKDGEVLVWLNDASTGKAGAGATVSVYSDSYLSGKVLATGKADKNGVARLNIPSTSNGYGSFLAEGAGGRSCFGMIGLDEKSEARVSELYYTALYTDRECYLPSDTVRFWGIIRPRAGAKLPKTVRAEITTGGNNGALKGVTLSVGDDGTYQGSLPTEQLRMSGYSLRVVDAADKNRVYDSKWLTVESYQKPAYILNLTPQKQYYSSGETVELVASANYYDGTPVSGGRVIVRCGKDSKEVTLDEKGQALCSFSAAKTYVFGNDWRPYPVRCLIQNTGSDTYVAAFGWFNVVPNTVAVEAETVREGEVELKAAEFLLDKWIGGGRQFEDVTGSAATVSAKVKIQRVEYVRTEGELVYDPVSKTSSPRVDFSTERSEVETRNVTVNGKTTIKNLPWENDSFDGYYWLEIEFGGAAAGIKKTIYCTGSGYAYNHSRSSNEYSFAAKGSDSFAEGEQVALGLYKGGKISNSTGRVFYSVVRGNVIKTGVYSKSEKFSFASQMMPNAVICGAYFDGKRVHIIQSYSIDFKTETRALKVKITPESSSLRPGEKASVLVELRDRMDRPATGSVCVSIVDEAAFAVQDQDFDLLDTLYSSARSYMWVRQTLSHSVSLEELSEDEATSSADKPDPGTGGGGGPGYAVRDDFKDTAFFTTIKTDSSGKARASFTLPDNLTAWRITALAITPKLEAGNTSAPLVVSLPFYLRAVVPESFVEGDDVAISVMAVGQGDGQAAVKATLFDSQGKELKSLSTSGAVGSFVPVNFGKLNAGSYYTVLSGQGEQSGDALRQEITVLKTGLTADTVKTIELSEISAIKSLRYPVTVNVFDARMDGYMEAVSRLIYQSGGRAERVISRYVAWEAFNAVRPAKYRVKVEADPLLNEIQRADGGVCALPFSESSPTLTALALMTAPDLISTQMAEAFLGSALKNAAFSPEERAAAYMGLAAAKRPLKAEISELLKNSDGMSAVEKLRYGTALALLGDTAGGKAVYDSFAGRRSELGNLVFLKADDMKTQFSDTAAALVLASYLSHPDATGLLRSLTGQQRANNDYNLYQLEMLCYLKRFRLPQKGDSASFEATIAGKRQTYKLEGAQSLSFDFSGQALGQAAFKAGGGKVKAMVLYTDYADKTTLAENSAVSVSRSYAPLDGNYSVGRRVKATVTVSFSKDAAKGYYRLYERIPSGLQYLPRDSYSHYDWRAVYTDNEGQNMYSDIYYSGHTNTYSYDYLLSASQAGEFMVEPIYVEAPQQEGLSAKSAAGKLLVGR